MSPTRPLLAGAPRRARALLALLPLAAPACGGGAETAGSAPPVFEGIQLGQVSVTYLDEDPPALGRSAEPFEQWDEEEGPRLLCQLDAQRTVAWVAFGSWSDHTCVRLAVCRGPTQELGAVDLIEYVDVGPSVTVLPVSGRVLLRRGHGGELAFAFDLQTPGVAAPFQAHGVVEPAGCRPSELTRELLDDQPPLPDCPPSAAR